MAIGWKTLFNAVRQFLIKVAKLANIALVGLRRLVATLLQRNRPVELCQLGQLQSCEKPTKYGT